MNKEYWKSLINADVPIIPVMPGVKKPIGLWRDLTSVEEWRKYKEEWNAWAEGPEAVAKLDETTAEEFAARLGLPEVPEEFNFGLLCCDFAVALDFDSDATETFRAWLGKMSNEDPAILDRVYIEKTPHGFHVVFRTTMEKRNEKLAERPGIEGKPDKHGKPEDPKKKQTLIETRGKGGFLVIAPTPGYVKSRGDLASLPILTDTEVNTLYRVSRSFSQFPPPIERAERTDWEPRNAYDHTGWRVCDPVERYTAAFSLTDWRQLLEKYGWKFLYQTPEGRYRYQRPGKGADEDDYSGDLYYHNGCWLLYIFTTNSDLPNDEGLTGLKFLQHQVCGGDIYKAISLASKYMCGASLFALGMLCNNNQ
ncbi:MAG: bifunctional DNA primase/polymerase [Thermoguttaceae bacterium]|nr:bifunctional DNA primase/polymerase [Thermoguttaceae bacterium]